MRDDPEVIDLVRRARDGDTAAWDGIVERYTALLWGICRRYGLSGSDADDVAASVWLRLVERLETLREPAALPGWLVVTTQHECLQVLRGRKRQLLSDDPELNARRPSETVSPEMEAGLVVEERHHALRLAFAELPERCRELLRLLFSDPPPSYAEIAERLGIQIGAIGPNRGRCLNRLRRTSAMARLALE
ncbi:RNA polymerase sigma factor [Microlunatus ginsengisoli]|uniref:Sigma-70 family RNA polymerase sigma factor n=1 Tax=Microlunatus ginsengisoli TaxID=363863 RepID=A0ABP6ZNV0_9ACTN